MTSLTFARKFKRKRVTAAFVGELPGFMLTMLLTPHPQLLRPSIHSTVPLQTVQHHCHFRCAPWGCNNAALLGKQHPSHSADILLNRNAEHVSLCDGKGATIKHQYFRSMNFISRNAEQSTMSTQHTIKNEMTPKKGEKKSKLKWNIALFSECQLKGIV